MPFGQMGFTATQEGGGGPGFFQNLPAILAAVTGGRGFFPPDPTRASIVAPILRGGAAVARQLPGILGGLAAGELFEGLGGGGEVVPDTAFFRTTVARLTPTPEISMIGPDGKCHTWLHATPRGWKINRSNVTGRRRHHHHPR